MRDLAWFLVPLGCLNVAVGIAIESPAWMLTAVGALLCGLALAATHRGARRG